MARIRTVKPEFWTSEQIVERSTTARLLFIGLWNFCDDAGRHPASCRRIKMEVFPDDAFDLSDIEAWVQELIDGELIVSYVVADKGFWQVTGWHHQKIEKPTVRYPAPEKGEVISTAIRRPLSDPSPPESNVRESNVRESKKKKKTTPPPSDGAKPPKPPNDDFDAFWAAVPNKVGKGFARKAYGAAVKRLTAHLGWTPQRAHERLAERMTAFAATPKAKGLYCPHPATWLNQDRYDDDPAMWNKEQGTDGKPKPASQLGGEI